MNVLIKDMEMPENCWDCQLCDPDHMWCEAVPHKLGTLVDRPSWCPLEEVEDGE